MTQRLFTLTEPQINGYRTDPQTTYLNRVISVMPEPEKSATCTCREYVPDTPDCPDHGELYRQYQEAEREEGSDTSMRGSLADAGYDGGIF